MDTDTLLKNISEVLSRKRISRAAFAESLNKFLQAKHRRAVTRSRMVIIYRYFGGKRKPNSDTILAMNEWYEANKTIQNK